MINLVVSFIVIYAMLNFIAGARFIFLVYFVVVVRAVPIVVSQFTVGALRLHPSLQLLSGCSRSLA